MNYALAPAASTARRGSIDCAFMAAQLPASSRVIPRISHPSEGADESDDEDDHPVHGSQKDLVNDRVLHLRGGDTPERKPSTGSKLGSDRKESLGGKKLDSAKIWKSISNFKVGELAEEEIVLPSESEVRRMTLHMPNAVNMFTDTTDSVTIDLQRVDSRGFDMPLLRKKGEQYVLLRDLEEVHEFSDLATFIQENQKIMSVDNLTESHPFWIDVEKPTKKDLMLFQQVFGLHPLTTEDILTESPREKVEFYDTYMFLAIQYLAKTPQTQDLSVNDIEDNSRMIYLVMFQNGILSFHSTECRYLDRVVRRLRRLKKNRTPDFAMYTLLDEIIDEFSASVKFAENEVERLDDEVMTAGGAVHRAILGKIGLYRRSLASMHRYLQPKRDIIGGMTMREMDLLLPNTQLYLRDVLDHILSMLIAVESAREAINVAQANYFAKVSLDINRVMKTLNLSATIILPLTLITGIFGMNVKVPGQVGDHDNLNSFWIIIACMFCGGIFMVYYFKKNKYIGRDADV